jgi:hypothetical protein
MHRGAAVPRLAGDARCRLIQRAPMILAAVFLTRRLRGESDGRDSSSIIRWSTKLSITARTRRWIWMADRDLLTNGAADALHRGC